MTKQTIRSSRTTAAGAVAQPATFAHKAIHARAWIKRRIKGYRKCQAGLHKNADKLWGMEADRLQKILDAGPTATMREYERERRSQKENAANFDKRRLRATIAQLRQKGIGWWEGLTEEQTAAALAKNQREEDFEDLLYCIEAARGIWRKYPALVESPEMPEPYATQFREVLGDQTALNDECEFTDVFATDYPEKLQQSEREAAVKVRSESVREQAIRLVNRRKAA